MNLLSTIGNTVTGGMVYTTLLVLEYGNAVHVLESAQSAQKNNRGNESAEVLLGASTQHHSPLVYHTVYGPLSHCR